MGVKIRINPGWTREARQEAEETGLLVTQQLISGIVRRSPVAGVSPSQPPPKGGSGGTNKRSIGAVSPERKARGVWQIATSSGYGGWLDQGTRKMKGRFYFMAGINWLIGQLRKSLKKSDLESPLPDSGRPM